MFGTPRRPGRYLALSEGAYSDMEPTHDSSVRWREEAERARAIGAQMTDPEPRRIMAELLKRGRYADEIMPMLAAEEATKLKKAFASSGRNDRCPCGSGKKFKRCHGGNRTEPPPGAIASVGG